jgi:DNA-binding Xre family transcriptional regulator
MNTHMNATKPRIDKGWFQEKLAAKKLSQRKLASTLGMDASSLTLMLQGKRRMTNQEATSIGKALGYPVTEILRRAGLDVRDDVRKIPITGYVGAGGAVTMLPAGTHDMVVSPADVPQGSYALQKRMAGNPGDGWLDFVDGAHCLPEDMLGRFCLATLSDGRAYMASVSRGYKAGLHNLIILCHQNNIIENQSVAWCSPVLWIKPA